MRKLIINNLFYKINMNSNIFLNDKFIIYNINLLKYSNIIL